MFAIPKKPETDQSRYDFFKIRIAVNLHNLPTISS